jgi:hypothetical protein
MVGIKETSASLPLKSLDIPNKLERLKVGARKTLTVGIPIQSLARFFNIVTIG